MCCFLNIIFNCFNIILCLLLIGIVSYEFYFMIKKLKYHLNFRTLCLVSLSTIFLDIISSFIVDIINLVSKVNISNNKFDCFFCYLLFWISIYNFYGVSVTRLCLWMMCCERVLAILITQTYETKNSRYTAFIIVVLPFAYGLNIKNILHIWPDYNNKVKLFNLLFEFITLLLLFVLILLHFRMKSKLSNGSLKLAEKYQLKENIRIFKWFTPLVVIFSVINIFYNLYQFITQIIFSINVNIPSLHNSLLYIVYIVMGIIIILKRSKNKKKAVQICEGDVCIRIPKKNPDRVIKERLSKAKESGGANIKIITQENKAINMSYDQQSYFNILKQSW